MKAVVTGGCGFIGSSLVMRGLKEGWEVVVYDDYSALTEQNLGPETIESVTTVKADVRDLSKLKEAVRDADVVFHLAARSREVGSVNEPHSYFEVNVVGTVNVLEACRGTSALVVFPSSWVVYDKKDITFGTEVKEDSKLGPVTPYGLSKLIGEEYANKYNALYHENIISVRLSNVYGVGDRHRVIAAMTDRALQDERIVVHGDRHYLNFIHVDDAVEILTLIARKQHLTHRTLNLGTSENVNLKDIAHMIINEGGSASHVKVEPLLPHDCEFYCPDLERLRAELGYESSVTLESGIKSYVKWRLETATGSRNGYRRIRGATPRDHQQRALRS